MQYKKKFLKGNGSKSNTRLIFLGNIEKAIQGLMIKDKTTKVEMFY